MSALDLVTPAFTESQIDGLVVRLPLDELRPGPSLREGGINAAHVDSLVQLEGRWPPILVASRDRTIVDGHHRVMAAKALGHVEVSCVYFDGTPDDAYLESVRRNVVHGLPLTLRERERAATQIVQSYGRWSDRRIAELCSLSPTTVARVRKSVVAASTSRSRRSEATGQLSSRIGRDGRVRPIDATPLRSRIVKALHADPEASLRVLASKVGASPETVRRVRHQLSCQEMGDGDGFDCGRQLQVAHTNRHRHDDDIKPAMELLAAFTEDTTPSWTADPAVLSTQAGAVFARWLARTRLTDWRKHVAAVPLSRVYEVADEARQRAEHWQQFALALEDRAKPH
jgi:ParB-like chromosome segregation protein Spo0J